MSVRRVVTMGASTRASMRRFDVSGSTYNPNDGSIEGLPPAGPDAPLVALSEVCSCCNEAGVKYEGDGKYKHLGMPTEAALKVLV